MRDEFPVDHDAYNDDQYGPGHICPVKLRKPKNSRGWAWTMTALMIGHRHGIAACWTGF